MPLVPLCGSNVSSSIQRRTSDARSWIVTGLLSCAAQAEASESRMRKMDSCARRSRSETGVTTCDVRNAMRRDS